MTLRHDHPFSLRIELIAATPQGALRAEIELPEGALAGQVQHHLPADPQWHLAWKLSAGLSRNGECLQADDPLRDGDCLGLLRALLADPKLARQQRVDARRKTKAQAGVPDRWTRKR